MQTLQSVQIKCIILFVSSIAGISMAHYFFKRAERKISVGILDLIGNTPLIKIESLSKATKCTILAKVEWMNPGGTTKDRAAKFIIEEAEKQGLLLPGGTIYEGTSGSTGISLALIAKVKGYKCHIIIPDDQAKEKYELLERYGATVEKVRPVSFFDPDHFCKLAEKRAKQDPCGFFANQFENLSNMKAHETTTGPEIWDQTDGKVDGVVVASGTGGTIAGISRYLKSKNPQIRVCLADPPGSGLFNKVTRGVCYAIQEAEGTRKRHQVDTITEGIGLNRVTANFNQARIDKAYSVTDREAVEMGHYLMKNDGLFVGSSSAVNCVGAVHLARELGPGHIIVTVLCDSGQRHLTKFWNTQYLKECELVPKATGLEFLE